MGEKLKRSSGTWCVTVQSELIFQAKNKEKWTGCGRIMLFSLKQSLNIEIFLTTYSFSTDTTRWLFEAGWADLLDLLDIFKATKFQCVVCNIMFSDEMYLQQKLFCQLVWGLKGFQRTWGTAEEYFYWDILILTMSSLVQNVYFVLYMYNFNRFEIDITR